jgi:uncharacterized membrane protein
MMNSYLFVLTLLAALGCAMMAGVFFAFSAFVMKALARLPAEQGVAAMQAINVAAVTFAFMAALFGTAAACGALAVLALFAWDEGFAPYLLVGSVLYLVGTILLTIAYHVPRNADAESHWRRYLSAWTAWNHVRAGTALAAAAVLTIALHV